MAATEFIDLPGYRKYTEEGGAHEVLHMLIVTEFWISEVNTFGALYEMMFQSVYSRMSKSKLVPQASKQCVTKFFESFPGIFPFTQLILFDEGEMEIITFATR